MSSTAVAPQITTVIETITPELAATYLQFNTRNRREKVNRQRQYARDILAGRWRLTHQGIAFANNGILLDGQNRLKAIILANVPVRMAVTRGLDPESQAAMDDHSRRTVADSARLSGEAELSLRGTAIINCCFEFGGGGENARATRLQILEQAPVFAPAIEFADRHFTNTRGVQVAPSAAAIAVSYFYVPNLDRLDEFCRYLYGRDMATREEDRAPMLLRDFLLNLRNNSREIRLDVYRRTQRAIHGFFREEKMRRLGHGDIFYPFPLVNAIR